MGGKTRETNFPEKKNSASKECWEGIVGKNAKNVFYIHTNIVTKKRGEKARGTIFPETHK